MLSVAAPQVSATDGVSDAVADSAPGALGAIPSFTWTLTPAASDESVVNEMVDTGSLSVLPTSRGASLRSVVEGVVSMRFVSFGDDVGLAVPTPSRIVTPTVAGEPAVKLSKLPYGVRKSRSKKVPSPRGIRTSFTGPLPR